MTYVQKRISVKVSRHDRQYSVVRRTALVIENSDHHDDENSISYLLWFYQILENVPTKLTKHLGPECEET